MSYPMQSQPQIAFTFDGPDLTTEDHERLTGQILRVYEAILDGKWRSVTEIAAQIVTDTNAQYFDPETSISAQIRNLRKKRFGGYDIPRRYDGSGLYRFRLNVEAIGSGIRNSQPGQTC